MKEIKSKRYKGYLHGDEDLKHKKTIRVTIQVSSPEKTMLSGIVEGIEESLIEENDTYNCVDILKWEE